MKRRQVNMFILASSLVASAHFPSLAEKVQTGGGNQPKVQPSKHPESIQRRVYRVVAEQLGIPRMRIRPQARFVEDLKADSLDIVELNMAFENEFGVEITDAECEGMTTVGKAISYFQTLPIKRGSTNY